MTENAFGSQKSQRTQGPTKPHSTNELGGRGPPALLTSADPKIKRAHSAALYARVILCRDVANIKWVRALPICQLKCYVDSVFESKPVAEHVTRDHPNSALASTSRPRNFACVLRSRLIWKRRQLRYRPYPIGTPFNRVTQSRIIIPATAQCITCRSRTSPSHDIKKLPTRAPSSCDCPSSHFLADFPVCGAFKNAPCNICKQPLAYTHARSTRFVVMY